MSWPFATLESFTDLSAPPVRTLLPSGDKARVVIASAWAGNGFVGGTGNCHALSKPSSPIVYAWLPLGLRATPVTGDPCAPITPAGLPSAVFQKCTVPSAPVEP